MITSVENLSKLLTYTANELEQTIIAVHYSDVYTEAFEQFRKKYLKLSKTGEGHGLYCQFTSYAKDVLEKSPFESPDHADPVGIYGYPLKYVVQHPADVWYGAQANFLRVLKNKSKHKLFLPNLTESDCETILRKMGIKDGKYLMGFAKKLFKHRFGNTGNRDAKAFMSVVQMKLEEVGETLLEQIKQGNKDTSNIPMRTGKEQTALFLKAGYDAVEDDSKNQNHAIINPREPQQIIFLNRNAFEVVETFTLRHGKPSDYLTHPTLNGKSPVIKKAAAQIADALDGDKIVEWEGEYSEILYWTKAGRQISITISKPDSWYKEKKLGEKVHKETKLSSPDNIRIKITTEHGDLQGMTGSEGKIKDMVEDVVLDWNRIKDKPVEEDWVPLTKTDHLEQVKRANDKRTEDYQAGEQAKRIKQGKVQAEGLAKIAKTFGLKWTPPTNEADFAELDGTVTLVAHYAQTAYRKIKEQHRYPFTKEEFDSMYDEVLATSRVVKDEEEINLLESLRPIFQQIYTKSQDDSVFWGSYPVIRYVNELERAEQSP